MPGTEARWTWESIRPGTRYWPLPEITVAPAGDLGEALRSMRRIRPFSRMTVTTAGASRFSGERMVTSVIQVCAGGDEFALRSTDDARPKSVARSAARANRAVW